MNKINNWKRLYLGQLDSHIFIQRAQVLRLIRRFFEDQNFLEVETPYVVKHPGTEPYLNLFETRIETMNLKEDGYLITSPELHMKKILAAGYPNIFQLGRSFRNGEIGSKNHNPEFAMLEWYRVDANYLDIMQDTENMIKFISQQLHDSLEIKFNDIKIDLSGSWIKMSVQESFMKYVNIDLNEYLDCASFFKKAQAENYIVQSNYSWDDIFFSIFLNNIEPYLPKDKPVFLYDYPSTQVALCAPKKENPFYAERFELYIGGLEICNAFTELLDPDKVRLNFESDLNLRKELGKSVFKYDEDFIEAVVKINKSCGGNALGVDRLVMLMLNQTKIQDVVFFPYEDL